MAKVRKKFSILKLNILFIFFTLFLASEADLSVSQINESGIESSPEKKKKKKRKSNFGTEGT